MHCQIQTFNEDKSIEKDKDTHQYQLHNQMLTVNQ